MTRLKIAIVGSGIAGLSAAWLLSKRHQVTLYEATRRLGGHANTADVETPDGTIPADTGFLVYNERNYPNFTALLDHLRVSTTATEMSFAFSLRGGTYEYSGSGVAGFFGQPRNVMSPRHWYLLRDISRFFATAAVRISTYREEPPLGEFLLCEGYGRSFIDDHIVPMGAAIWSTSADKMLRYPARAFVDFYANHGLLQLGNRPVWRTVTGGSRNYVRQLADSCDMEVLTCNPVVRVARHANYVHVTDTRDVSRPFDQVVLATHADDTLRLLDIPDETEAELLSKFKYQTNRAVLHRDPRFMPRRKRIWSSWNYLKSAPGHSGLCVTYWLNRLQKLPTRTNLFVTLNPETTIHPKAVESEFEYSHPVFDAAALTAQRRLWALQGVRRTWYCGSYFGHGFHEDSIQSGLAVAEQLGGLRRPWNVADESSRIALPLPEAAE